MQFWLKSKEIGLGHEHANFVIVYLRLRSKDPKVSALMKSGLLAQDIEIFQNEEERDKSTGL